MVSRLCSASQLSSKNGQQRRSVSIASLTSAGSTSGPSSATRVRLVRLTTWPARPIRWYRSICSPSPVPSRAQLDRIIGSGSISNKATTAASTQPGRCQRRLTSDRAFQTTITLARKCPGLHQERGRVGADGLTRSRALACPAEGSPSGHRDRWRRKLQNASSTSPKHERHLSDPNRGSDRVVSPSALARSTWKDSDRGGRGFGSPYAHLDAADVCPEAGRCES